MSEYFFTNARIFDGYEVEPRDGCVHVRGNRVVGVLPVGAPEPVAATVVDCGGRTLMPGLIEPHGHLSFPDGRSVEFTAIGTEEILLATVGNARLALDCGYTSVFSAASLRPRVDVVIRDAITAGRIPGPRYLACSPELTVTGGLGDTNRMHLPWFQGTTFSWVADGADEFRKAARMFAREGVDNLKVHLSGDLGAASAAPSEQTPITDEEIGALTGVARAQELNLVCHARSAQSVLAAVRHGIRVINHGNYADEEALDALESVRDTTVVIPAAGITHALATADGRWGVDAARSAQYEQELAATVDAVAAMRKRGIRVLPGGDYGFAYTPHGTYARDLQLFVDIFDFTPAETLVAATRYSGQVMGRPDELGVIRAGGLADLLLVDGDPLADIRILQDRERLLMIMKDGGMHKAPPRTGVVRPGEAA